MLNSSELIDRWYADTALRPQLAAKLQDPVIKAALEILHALALEPVAPQPGTTCDLIQYGAAVGFTRNGAWKLLRALEDLTKPRPPKVPEVESFNPEAQEKLTKKVERNNAI